MTTDEDAAMAGAIADVVKDSAIPLTEEARAKMLDFLRALPSRLERPQP